MTRHLRNLLYFVVGFLLAANFVLAHAETISATSQYWGGSGLYYCQGTSPPQGYKTETEAVKFMYEVKGYSTVAGTTYRFDGVSKCQVFYANGTLAAWAWLDIWHGTYYSCPDGQNWTLNLAAHTCSRPDCVAPETRQADGTCAATNCPSYDGESTDRPGDQPTNCSCPSGTRWMRFMGCRKSCAGSTEQSGMDIWGGTTMVYPKGSSEGCFSGCGVQPGGTSYWEYPDGSRAYSNSTYTGWACSGAGVVKPKPESPKEPPGKPSEPAPKCGEGEGVLTSSSGKVGCVPPADPNSGLPPGRTPTVAEKTKTETYPDASTKTTTDTTVTDPGTMASHTSTTTTTTAAAGGGAGQAGTPGTTTGKTESSSGGGDGTCNPQTSACGGAGSFGENGDLYEKKYPDGLSGLLTKKHEEIKETPVYKLVDQLAPTNLSFAGQCPTWTFDGSVNGRISLGAMTFAPPCWVWDAVRAILLVTSLLLARRLVFGG